MKAPEAIDSLRAVSGRYRAVFCDVWGVVHDGLAKHPRAEAALRRARADGATVVLLTNSPRPSEGVAIQLDGLGFGRDAYDAIVTSGDVTRALIATGERRVLHIGPERNKDLFTGLDLDFVGEDEAEGVVVTGLFHDETEGPEDYRAILARLKARDLVMVCANPDIVVHRGERLIYCAGMIAREYEAIGGTVRMAGKPFLPIYELAQRTAKVAGPHEVLAVGDGLNTDIRGANAYGCDALLVMEGIHRDELGGPDATPETVGTHLAQKALSARYFLPTLS